MDIWVALQYLGSALAIAAQVNRSMFPKYIIASFTISTISAIILGIYFLDTGQNGLILIEVVFIITNTLGIFQWRRHNQALSKKERTEQEAKII